MGFFYSSFMLLGLFVFLRAIYYIGWSIHTYDLLYGGNKFDWARRLDDYTYTDDGTESWALVTNVGNGLGKRFAEELAALSFNVVLHDTSLAKAVALQTALQNKYPSHQFRTVVMDPSFHLNFKNGPSPNPICDKVRDITLKVLVNNVGTPPTPDATLPNRGPDQEPASLINRSTMFPTLLILSLAPKLRACAPSLILNIEAPEQPGAQPVFLNTPCKAYLRSLTRQLASEMKASRTRVEVIGIKAGEVAGMGETGRDGTGNGLLQPVIGVDEFVQSTLAKVGRGETVLAPYWLHELMSWWPKLLPELAREWLRARMLGRRVPRNRGPKVLAD